MHSHEISNNLYFEIPKIKNPLESMAHTVTNLLTNPSLKTDTPAILVAAIAAIGISSLAQDLYHKRYGYKNILTEEERKKLNKVRILYADEINERQSLMKSPTKQ